MAVKECLLQDFRRRARYQWLEIVGCKEEEEKDEEEEGEGEAQLKQSRQ